MVSGNIIGARRFFFSCIAERARGMVGQLSRNAKAKKGEIELHAGVICMKKTSEGLWGYTKKVAQSQANRVT